MSLSLGGDSGQTAMITAVNNAVEAGIVTVFMTRRKKRWSSLGPTPIAMIKVMV